MGLRWSPGGVSCQRSWHLETSEHHLKSPKRSYHLPSVKHTAFSTPLCFVCFLSQNTELLHRCLASFAFQSHGRNNKTRPAITRFHVCTWAWWHTLSLSVLWRPRQGDLSSRKDPVQWYDPISKSMKRNNNNKKHVCYLPSLSHICAFYLTESFRTNNTHTGKQLPMCDFAQPCPLLTFVMKTHGMENQVER